MMTIPSLAEFVAAIRERPDSADRFSLETEHLLEVRLSGDSVWTKHGSMVAYLGSVKFRREGIFEQGLGNLLKKALSGEGATLTKAEGTGRVFLADKGKRVCLFRLEKDALIVNGNDVLAFESAIENKITMMRRIAGMISGGLFNIRLSGSGLVAITTHHKPVTLAVKPGKPVMTDPNATVAWSASLDVDLRSDVSLKTLIGRGSGETFQMEFIGDGFVIVQPYEETPQIDKAG